MATYSIRDLENVSGIKAHTIRMWEQRYGILRPQRTDTNIRFYDDTDLRLLLSISMLNCNGLKISQIARMSPNEIHQSCGSMGTVCGEISQQVQQLSLAMIELDEERFEKTIANSTLKYGLEETMLRIVYPFFERVGVMWQTGTVIPAQEHFISNLMRQKLIVAIDALPPVRGVAAEKYILYLPEGEMHELGLLFACYLLRSQGRRVIYLGQNVPDVDLESIMETYSAGFLLTILTLAPGKESTKEYLERLGKRFPHVQVYASGHATENVHLESTNVSLLPRFTDLIHMLGLS